MPKPKQKQKRPKTDHVAAESADLVAERTERLRELVPEAFSDGRVDFEKLRAALGDLVDDRPERYSFSWAGKRDAIRLLQTPSRATLLPCPDESLDWESTEHLFIEGDNLEVLKLLYKSYAGRVKMIYIDPPYNTGHDFIYPDNFADPLNTYLRLTGQSDEAGNLLTSNPETSGRYHSAWLSMMYARLFVARQLLRDDGVIFVSIDDSECANLRLLMNELFGEENFIASFVWQKRYSRDNRPIVGAVHDYIFLYARNPAEFAQVRNLLPPDEESTKVYKNPNNDPKGRWRPIPMTAQGTRPNQMYKITTPTGVVHEPPRGRCWSMVESEYKKLLAEGRIWFGSDGNGQPNVIRYLSEVEGFVPWTWWPHTECGHTDEAKKEIHEYFGKDEAFDTPKPVRLMRRLIQLATKEHDDDIVLDFFAGSCTLAEALFEQNREDGGNRRAIVVQLPEPTGATNFSTIAEIGNQRMRKAIAQLRDGENGVIDFKDRGTPEDLGFRVFKLAESHYARWSGTAEQTPDDLAKQIEMFNDALLPGWEPTGVIYEVLLKEGYSLTSRIEKLGKKDAGPNIVYRVTDDDRGQSFPICLDDKVDAKTPRALELEKDDLFICRDPALDDELAANLALQCRLKTI